MPQNNTDIAKLVDAAFEQALQAHGIDASQIDGAMLKNNECSRKSRAPASKPDSARLGGYSKSEFRRAPRRPAHGNRGGSGCSNLQRSADCDVRRGCRRRACRVVGRRFGKLTPDRRLALQNEVGVSESGLLTCATTP